MEKEKLRELYSNNSSAKIFFDHMANRQRNQNETKVDRIVQLLKDEGHSISRGEIVSVFKDLEEYKCGQFVAGRWGWPSRFVWDVGSLSGSQFAVGETEEVEEVKEESDEELGRSDSLKHTFNLRADLPIEFILPVDLTEKEAERLTGFIKALPMEDYE